jgi:glycine betaine/proline transport system substrate-binding protein
MLMSKGENKEVDVIRHAKMWIKSNQKTFDSWIAQAQAAK